MCAHLVSAVSADGSCNLRYVCRPFFTMVIISPLDFILCLLNKGRTHLFECISLCIFSLITWGSIIATVHYDRIDVRSFPQTERIVWLWPIIRATDRTSSYFFIAWGGEMKGAVWWSVSSFSEENSQHTKNKTSGLWKYDFRLVKDLQKGWSAFKY